MIDITSLIDLSFLLIIFFMVSSSFGSESAITVHLPKAVQVGEAERSKDIVISVNDKNEIFIDDHPFQRHEIQAEMERCKNSLKEGIVVIRGDRASSYDTIVYIIDALNRAGIPRFTIATVRGSGS